MSEKRDAAKRPIGGLLFDFYDTLGFIEPAKIEAGRRELARLAGVTMDEFAPLWRANARERTLGTAGDMEEQLRTMLNSIGHEPPPELVAEMAALEYRSWERGVALYPDTKSSLRELRRRGFKLGILSNCSVQAGAVIAAHGLTDLVDTVVMSFEVGLAKPDPAIYEYASAALSLAPSACAFVADGAGGELEGGEAVGMLTIKVWRPNQRRTEDPAVRGKHRVESLQELLELGIAL